MFKNPRVLVLGSTGMLGHQLCNYLINNSDYTLFDIARTSKFRKETALIDVRNERKLLDYIKDIRPDYIINCVGILISGSNKNIEEAIFINSYLPHMLARISDEIKSRLIHISTDCVFSGKKGSYIETDYRDGQGAYAQTKILGEVDDSKNLTLRTSVIGPEIRDYGEGLFHWFMNQENSVLGFTKAIWSGVTTIELAKVIKWSVDHHITGLYHVTNNSSINKYDLLNLFKKHTKKDIYIKPFEGKFVDKSFIDTRLLLDCFIPSYDKMISDMVETIINNRSLYSQYKAINFDKE
jgi:dTDP-4-dehydrorhamnose reductase